VATTRTGKIVQQRFAQMQCAKVNQAQNLEKSRATSPDWRTSEAPSQQCPRLDVFLAELKYQTRTVQATSALQVQEEDAPKRVPEIALILSEFQKAPLLVPYCLVNFVVQLYCLVNFVVMFF
jgi:hypothetical protein